MISEEEFSIMVCETVWDDPPSCVVFKGHDDWGEYVPERICRILPGYPGAGQPGTFCPQDGHFYCSECEHGVQFDPYTGLFPRFCPHCGAKAEVVDE